jgi:hypothetical protein
MADIKMTQIPMIRLELEGMKQEMMIALTRYHTQINENVEAQLKNIVEHFDYERVVTEVARQTINEAIQTYFRQGEGKQVITTAVYEALDQHFRDK